GGGEPGQPRLRAQTLQPLRYLLLDVGRRHDHLEFALQTIGQGFSHLHVACSFVGIRGPAASSLGWEGAQDNSSPCSPARAPLVFEGAFVAGEGRIPTTGQAAPPPESCRCRQPVCKRGPDPLNARAIILCGRGGTGRRARFRSWCPRDVCVHTPPPAPPFETAGYSRALPSRALAVASMMASTSMR